MRERERERDNESPVSMIKKKKQAKSEQEQKITSHVMLSCNLCNFALFDAIFPPDGKAYRRGNGGKESRRRRACGREAGRCMREGEKEKGSM